MNKIYLLFKLLAIVIIETLIFACSPQNIKEQTETAGRITGLPNEFETDQDNSTGSISSPASNINRLTLSFIEPPVNNFFKYLDFERTTYSKISIWGWSKDGKIAYSNYISFEGDLLYVYILDIISDKVLWQNTLDFFNDPHPFEENYNWFSGKFYLDFMDNYKNVCVQNGIEFIQAEFKGLPISYNNQTVNIIVEKNKTQLSQIEKDDLLIIGGNYESYKIIAENQGKQKIIHEKDFNINKGNYKVYADDVFVCGYFISPFENRALIVIGEFAHSWEGSDVTYSFAGCHLSDGFR